MAFTGTHNLNTNIAINTSSIGVYLFKEPNVNLSIKKITKKIKKREKEVFNASEDVFETKFLNKELNNFYGIQDNKSVQQLDFLKKGNYEMSTITQLQIYPTKLSSTLIDTRRRRDFIYEAWRDDPYLTGTTGFSFNLLRSREASTSSQRGYAIPALSSTTDSYSVWPLDFFTITDRPANETVSGELMWMFSAKRIYSSFTAKTSLPISTYIAKPESLSYTSSLPWVAPYFANSKPFQDSELKFSNRTSKKYINYSIIPEYNLSSKITNENFEILDSIAFSQSLDFYCTGSDYISTDTDAIISKGKIAFDIKSVLQTRPYKNFYPVFATLKASNIFSQTLSQYNTMHQFYQGKLTKMFFASHPFFSPGVLYNSIKAGLPSQFLSGKFLFNFDSIFDPLPNLLNKSFIGLSDFTKTLSTIEYKNFIFNFLNEVKNTFCKNNSLDYFSSSKEEEYQIFISGTNYLMDLSLNVGVVDEDSNPYFNWVGGVNYIGISSFQDLYTNVPSYFQSPHVGNETYNGLSCVRVSFVPPTTRKYTLDEIFTLSTLEFRINKSLTGTMTNVAYCPKLTSSFDIFAKETNKNGNFWKIKSKWEFPFLCLTGTIFTYSVGEFRKNDCGNRSNTLGWVGGLWHDYCKVPSEEQGLFLNLSDVSYTTASVDSISASLASMVGFQNETKRVGEINIGKVVKELLCIVPYRVSDGSFFEIPETFPIFSTNQKLAAKYILPPIFDTNRDGIIPKMMFCTEITDKWSKTDLAHIWQNLLPENGLSHKEFNTKYDVDLYCSKMLENQNIKFKIFKCKERSSVNPKGTWNGYNWPYDDFSLIELCKIDIAMEV